MALLALRHLAVVHLGVVKLERALGELLEVIWILHVGEIVVLFRLVARGSVLTLSRCSRLVGIRGGGRVRLTLVAAWSIGVSRPTDHFFSHLITGYCFILLDMRGQAHDIIVLSVDGIVQDLFFGLSLLSWLSTVVSLAFHILWLALGSESATVIVEQSIGPRAIVEDLVSSFVRSGPVVQLSA